MSDPAIEPVLQVSATAAAAGGLARVLMAMHAGERRWVALIIDAGIGCLLGIMAAAWAVWFLPQIRQDAWIMLLISGLSGMAGAIGTRILDLAVEAVRKRA